MTEYSGHNFLPIGVSRKKGAQKRAFFETPYPAEKKWLEAFKTLFVSRNAFFGVSKFAISEPFFVILKKHPSKPYFIVFFETHFLHIFQEWPFSKQGF